MALTQEQIAAFYKDRNAGYSNPETGEWISQSSGGIIDPLNPDMHIGNYNASGYQYSPAMIEQLGFDPNTAYTYGNGGISGSGQRGDQYDIMNSAGEDTGYKGTYSSTTGSDMAKLAATYMAILASAGAAGGMFAGAGAAGGGAAGGANGAFLGEGAMSGIGAWDGALSTSLSGAYGPAGLATAAGGGSTAAGAAGATGAGGGLLGGAGAAGAAGAGSNLLGIGSTLLGAAAGAKGQEASSTQTKDIPEWLKPYITGEGGLLSQTQQQLATSRSPERMAGWDQMRNVGMGLLNQPIAGNPTTGWTFGR